MMKTGVAVIGPLVLVSLVLGSRAEAAAEAEPASISGSPAPARRVLSSLDAEASVRAAVRLSAGGSAPTESGELAVEDELDGAWSKESVAARLAGLFGFLSMIVLLLVRWSGDDSVRGEGSGFDSAT